jgi:hypothetical protein
MIISGEIALWITFKVAIKLIVWYNGSEEIHMKKKQRKSFYLFILTLSVMFLLGIKVQEASAGKAKLTWTAPTTNSDNSALSDLEGYKVYYGTTARTSAVPGSDNGGYTSVVDVGNILTYTLESMADTGTTYFSVTAYDNSSSKNESVFSDQVKKTPGDVDKDNDVDIFDYNLLKDNFGNGENDPADIDLSNSVDIFDYNALKDNFGAVAS